MATRVAFADADELQARIDDYFAACAASKETRTLKSNDLRIRYQRPTMAGLAVYLGVSRETLYSYLEGDPKDAQLSPEMQLAISGTLARAQTRIAADLMQSAIDGDGDAKTTALLLGAMGYTDKSDAGATVTIKIDGACADWAR